MVSPHKGSITMDSDYFLLNKLLKEQSSCKWLSSDAIMLMWRHYNATGASRLLTLATEVLQICSVTWLLCSWRFPRVTVRDKSPAESASPPQYDAGYVATLACHLTCQMSQVYIRRSFISKSLIVLIRLEPAYQYHQTICPITQGYRIKIE